MSGVPRYTATDLARHPFERSELEEFPPGFRQHLAEAMDEDSGTTVGEVIAWACDVGYGGHFDEVMPQTREDEVMAYLEDYLGPLFSLEPGPIAQLLNQIREEWTGRLRVAMAEALVHWVGEGFDVKTVEDTEDPLAAYLAMKCDEPSCDRTATHNQAGRKVCNGHLDQDAPAFARDD